MTTDHESNIDPRHWEFVRNNPDRVRANLAAAVRERDECLAKLQRARSPHNKTMWRGRAGWAQKMVDRYTEDLRRAGLTAALALALIPLTTHASTPTFDTPVHPTDAYLSGCAITTWEDGSRRAECDEDGAVLAYDADGQRYVNDAGTPLRAPHHWYVVK